MNTAGTARHDGSGGANVARISVGLVWLAGAIFNALVTLRMADPYGWIAEGSPLRVHRWFFGQVVGAHPAVWTLLLVGWEACIGALTLMRGGRSRIGLMGGALFSAFLFSLASSYTMVMGPFALFLAWLAGKGDRKGFVGRLRRGIARRGADGGPVPA